jgi:hypothetical protein
LRRLRVVTSLSLLSKDHSLLERLIFESMKLLIEVKDSKAAFLLELLRSLPFVKVKETVNDERETVLEGIREAVEEMKEIKAGRKKGRPLSDLLDEL